MLMSVLVIPLVTLFQSPTVADEVMMLKARVAGLEKLAADSVAKANIFIETAKSERTNHLSRIETLERRLREMPTQKADSVVPQKLDDLGSKIDEIIAKVEQGKPIDFTNAGVVISGFLMSVGAGYIRHRSMRTHVDEKVKQTAATASAAPLHVGILS